MRSASKALPALVLLCLVRVAAAATEPLVGGPAPKDLVKVTARAKAEGTKVGIAIELDIAAGWHINAHELEDEYLIPTTIDLQPPAGMTIGKLTWPAPLEMSFSFAPDAKLKVYEGKVNVTGEGTLEKPLAEAASIPGKLRYQACNDKQCLPPKPVEFKVSVAPSEAASEAPSPASPAAPAARSSAAQPPPAGGAAGSAGMTGALKRRFNEGGLALKIALSYVFGLLLTLTPCVYPMIPVTIGYFGNQSSGRMRRSFGLAAFYVLGMAVTYSLLGVMAALSGSMFGKWLQSPWVLVGLAGLMVALGLSSFGLFELRLPSALTSRAHARGGFGGALVMGLLMGIVAAPCIGPLVVFLITYVATQKDAATGFALFFALALGLGTPFLFLAGFAGSLKSLPRSGAWMVGVKRIFGLLLFGVAIYFVGPLLEPKAFAVVWRLYALGAVIYLLGFEPLGNAPGKLGPSFKAAFAAATVVLFWLAGGFGAQAHEGIRFEPFHPAALTMAAETNRPVLIDFTAAWCVPCRELEARTFVDKGVAEVARPFAALRIDITRDPTPDVAELMKKYGVLGPPTVMFLCPDGTEHRDLRVEGYVDANAFEAALAAASSRSCPRAVASRL